jgi:hypothetical protein
MTHMAFSEIDKGHTDVGAPITPEASPWHPPPSYPPPRSQVSGSTDGRAIASLILAVFGIALGLPFGLPGMALGTAAYFLGKSAVSRIDSLQEARGGRSLAVSGWVLGAVAMAIGSAVTLVWLIVVLVSYSQPAASG